MPIPKYTDSVLGDNTQNQSACESNTETFHLHLGDGLARHGLMHGADCHGSSGRGGEDQTELTCHVHDEEFTHYLSSDTLLSHYGSARRGAIDLHGVAKK